MTAQPHGPGTTPRGVGGAAPAATQALAALPLAAILVAAVAMRPHLGTTIASHWSGGAHPDGFSPTWGSFWVTVLVTAGLLVFSTVASTFARRASWSRVWPAIATTVGGMLACSWILSAWATAAAPSPAEATLGPRLVLLLPALACGAGIYLLLPPTPAPHTAGARRPVRQVQPGEAASWTGVVTSRILEAAVVLTGAVFFGTLTTALVSGRAAAWTTSIVLFAASLLALAMAPVRLTVDSRGIRLVSVVLRVPLLRLHLANMESVTADTIDPMRWGGWGYRVSGAGIAYVARRGPGIVIERRRGAAVAITLDHPEEAAALANGLIAARSAPGPGR